MYIDILQRSTVRIKPKRDPGSEVTVNAFVPNATSLAELKPVVSHTLRTYPELKTRSFKDVKRQFCLRYVRKL